MLRYIAMFLLIFSAAFFISTDAFAKRFGGGKSFGMQRNVTQKQSSFSNNQHHAPTSHATQSGSRFGKWGAALAGLAAGGLLSYLLMGHGVGASIFSWLVIAMVVMLVVQFFRQRKMQTASNIHGMQHQSFENIAPSQSSSMSQPSATLHPINAAQNIPGFDESQFLRDAKAKFIRLQTAYDQKNLLDIREFTTPEVFSEIQLQLSERGITENYTEVLELRAELLEALYEFQVPVASVRFAGQMKESKESSPTLFEETWHFRGDANNNWRVAGIQQ